MEAEATTCGGRLGGEIEGHGGIRRHGWRAVRIEGRRGGGAGEEHGGGGRGGGGHGGAGDRNRVIVRAFVSGDQDRHVGHASLHLKIKFMVGVSHLALTQTLALFTLVWQISSSLLVFGTSRISGPRILPGLVGPSSVFELSELQPSPSSVESLSQVGLARTFSFLVLA
ncbi:hypothetical protein STAS_05276 [Striga asiatica]|uniref:Uncharacterized protein n=1 Tax=Striga asiatica TaxID=4170 RepID=A0A5A7PA10_STRAF|nr:hypothetical protein STAS_05276 [Striga asiatica]